MLETLVSFSSLFEDAAVAALLFLMARSLGHWRGWAAFVGQAVMVMEWFGLTWIYAHHREAYWIIYGYCFIANAVMITGIAVGMDCRKITHYACWILLMAQLFIKLDIVMQTDVITNLYHNPIESALWETIDFLWSTILLFDLYSEHVATPQRREQWHKRVSRSRFTTTMTTFPILPVWTVLLRV